MSINSVNILNNLASVEGRGVKAFAFAFINYHNSKIKQNKDVDLHKDKAFKAYELARRYIVRKFGKYDEFVKHYDKELGVADAPSVDDTMFEKVKKVQNSGLNAIVSFEDGGVVGLIDGSIATKLIDTVHARDFEKEFANCINKAEFCETLINKKSEKLGISSIQNIDVDDYSWYKEYLLDNGESVKINSNGVLINKEYFSFNDFLNNYKERLSEGAYYEFNKYCVKQDTGERLINPFNLDANDIDIDDIITSLSGINRFAGHTKSLQMSSNKDFYTVGQHTLSMYYAIKNHPEKIGLGGVSQAYRDKMAKQALLHEAFEGITGTDLISPFKYATKNNEYKIAENDAEAVMEKIFGMALMTPELKKIDKSLAVTEGYYLVGQGNVDWSTYGDIYDENLLMTQKSQVDVKNELKMIFEKEGLNKLLEDYRFYYNKNQRIYNTEINTDVVNANDDTTYKKTYQDNRAGKTKEEPWYMPVNFTSCETPSDYVCPPLTAARTNAGYTSRVNFVDLISGQISCSAHLTIASSTDPLKNTNQITDHTEVFINKSCLEKYSASENKDTESKTDELKKKNEEYLKNLKAQEYKYTVDYKTSGNNKFLDLADILDGVVSFNVDMFDFEQTLLTRELKTRSGYTTLPNEMIVTKFEKSLSNFLGLINGFDSHTQNEFLNNAQNQVSIRNASTAIANSSYFMLLDFWMKANDILVLLAQGIAFVFIAYNVILTWAMPAIGNKIMEKDSGENNPQRAIFGFIALIMLFAGDVEKLNIQYESKAQDLTQNELIVQQTNIQAAIQFLYSETNYWADAFAEIGIRAYLNGLNGSTGLFTGNQIDAMATEKNVLLKSIESYKTIETDMCYANYDVTLLKDAVKNYRSHTLSKNDGGNSIGGMLDGTISSADANPFPKSEAEAFAVMKISQNSAYDTVSPYNSSIADDSGFVKNEAKDKFRDPAYAPLNLSGCYENTKKRIAAAQRVREIDAQFAKLADPTVKDAKVEYMKVVNEIQWGLFAKQGYLSIAYLPATAMLIDNIGILGDLEDRENAAEAYADADTGFMESGTWVLQSVFEDLPYLTIFGGFNIAKMVHPVKEAMIDGAQWLGNKMFGPAGAGVSKALGALSYIKNKGTFGEKKEEVDIYDLKISAWLIKNILTTMVTVTLIVGSILIFTLLFIEKLFAFVASMFLLIYAFAKNQEDRVATAIAKIFAVAFKTILIVICIFLAMYSLELVSSLELIFVESFFKSMDMIENASWSYLAPWNGGLTNAPWDTIFVMISFFFKKYIFFGVTKFAFVILKLTLVIQMIWKMPGFMYELIYEKVHSVSDSVGETLQSVNEKHSMRV